MNTSVMFLYNFSLVFCILARCFVTAHILETLSGCVPNTFPGKLIFSGSNRVENYLESIQLMSCKLDIVGSDELSFSDNSFDKSAGKISNFILLSRNKDNVEYLQYSFLPNQLPDHKQIQKVIFSRIFISIWNADIYIYTTDFRYFLLTTVADLMVLEEDIIRSWWSRAILLVNHSYVISDFVYSVDIPAINNDSAINIATNIYERRKLLSYSLIGQFVVNAGPTWSSAPPTYTCIQACALLFGGISTDYAGSTLSTSVNNVCYTDSYAIGCSSYSDTYSNCATYTATGCVSTYVMDNSCSSTNYCWKAILTPPTFVPTRTPTRTPTRMPTMTPTYTPTAIPTFTPSRIPTYNPTVNPSFVPTCSPTTIPTYVPTTTPTVTPTYVPTRQPTYIPTVIPTCRPTFVPTTIPTYMPSFQPTYCPTHYPTSQPSRQPTSQPTSQPSRQPSRQPTGQPSSLPSRQPSSQPSSLPSRQPLSQPTSQPSRQPSGQPSSQPSRQPSGQPSSQPTLLPSSQPSSQPSRQPTSQPSTSPTRQPSTQPSTQPSNQPTSQPSHQPTSQPSRQPSGQPVSEPTSQPSSQPSRKPSRQPSMQPTGQPSRQPISHPTIQPSGQPTSQPSCQPTNNPSRQPSSQPTGCPSMQPSSQPTKQPTSQPSRQPSLQPSNLPSNHPSSQPTSHPSCQPTRKPTRQPTMQPSNQPSTRPSSQPSSQPSAQPSAQPTIQPLAQPSTHPTSQPTRQPTGVPSFQPSNQPSTKPSCQPTSQPTNYPTSQPSSQPSSLPSNQPSRQPSSQPSFQPSMQPSNQPSTQPTAEPSSQPSSQPTGFPSSQPSLQPTLQPSSQPTSSPTNQPTCQPSMQPSSQPSFYPSSQPTCQPSSLPTNQPSAYPSGQPTFQPSSCPSNQPTGQPTMQPTMQPSGYPSGQPSSQPLAEPSTQPTDCPSSQPVTAPTSLPSSQPTSKPSQQPTSDPSVQPTVQPSGDPSQQPSSFPSHVPSSQPSMQPSTQPSLQPQAVPTRVPSRQPSSQPSQQPSTNPTNQPTGFPTAQPTFQPTSQPTTLPTISLISEISATEYISIAAARLEVVPFGYALKIFLSSDTNVFGGPGSFLCSKVISIVFVFTNGTRLPHSTDNLICQWVTSSVLQVDISFITFVSHSSVFLSVAIHNNTALKALGGNKQIDGSISQILLSKPTNENEYNPQFKVSVEPLMASHSFLVDILYETGESQPSYWVTGSGYVNVSCEVYHPILYNISELFTKSILEGLNKATRPNQFLLTLSESEVSILRSVKKPIKMTVVISLCNHWSRCGSRFSYMIWNTSSLIESNSTKFMDTFSVSLSPRVAWNGYCSDEVLIVSTLRSITAVDAVVDTFGMQYQWIFTNFTNATYVIPTASKSPSIFRLPPYSLSSNANTYVFLRVTDMKTGVVRDSSVVSMKCSLQPLIAHMVPSQKSLTMAISQVVVLNASSSFDPDARYQTTLSRSQLSYIWSCRSFSGSALQGASLYTLSESTRQRLALSSCVLDISSSMPASSGKIIQQLALNTPVVYVSSSTFDAINTTSEVFLTVVDASQPQRASTSTSVEVKIGASKPVAIQLITPRNSLIRVNAMQELVVTAQLSKPLLIAASSPGSLQYVKAEWSRLSSTEENHVPLHRMTSDNRTQVTLLVQPNTAINTAIRLTLRAGAMVQGGYYVFRLSCGGSVMDIEVTTNAVPTGGSVIVSPTSGWALETMFSIAATQWRDPDGDYPLQYSFSVLQPSKHNLWTTIPSIESAWVVELLYLPSGFVNQSYRLPLRCEISDSIGGWSIGLTNRTVVWPVRMNNNTWFGEATPSQIVLQNVISLVHNVSIRSTSLQVQQVATVIAAMVRQPMGTVFSYLSPLERLTLATTLSQVVNASLLITDVDQEYVARRLLSDTEQLVYDARIAIAKEQASKALLSLNIGGNSTSLRNQSISAALTSLTSQTANLMDSLSESMLSNSDGSNMQVVQVSTDTVKLSLALITLPPANPNSTAVQFMPQVSIPDSKTTINIAPSAGAGGSAMISVASFDASLFQAALASKKASETNSSNGNSGMSGGLPEPELVSDIISIKVSYSEDAGKPSLPSFVSNMEVSDNEEFVAPVLEHNCTIGVQESKSILCPESLVRMNLTCSGRASAVVRRKCPVPQRVCNVLSMTDFSVASDSYCHASQSSGSLVTCECGLDSSESGKNSSASLSALLESGSAINVAVMTQFVTGDFGGTVITGSASLTGNVAEQSKIVFVSFGLLWGFGIVSMLIHFFAIDLSSYVAMLYGKNKKKTSKVTTLSKATSMIDKMDGVKDVVRILRTSKQRAYVSMKKYVVSVLPSVYQPIPWLKRLQHQLFYHHKYISLFSFLGTLVRRDKKSVKAAGNIYEDVGLTNEQKRKKSVLQVAYMLTAITVSCFTLAVLYDIQYPADDGSCALHQDEVSCLTRKTVLDPARSYCMWLSRVQESPGVLTEYRDGKVIQSIPLESVGVESDVTQCVFDDSDASGYVMLAALVITTIVTLPFDVGLKLIFQLLEAKSRREKLVRSLITQKVMSTSNQVFALENTDASVLTTRRRDGRRQGILVAPGRKVPECAESSTKAHEEVTTVKELQAIPALFTRSSSEQPVLVNSPSSEVNTRSSGIQRLREIFTVVKLDLKAPTVTYGIRLARMACLESWIALHDQRAYGYVHPRVKAQMHTKYKQLMQSLNTSIDQTTAMVNYLPESAAAQQQLNNLMQQLHHATNEEFGMTVLQSLYRDILDQETVIGQRFAKILLKDFPVESYVSEMLQWILTVMLVVLNLGALYYVVLKGTSRGPGWQNSLLRVCFLDWFIEVLVHQSFQVYFVHFLLPNLIYEDVQVSLAALLRSSAALVHETMRYRGNVPMGELSLRMSLAQQQEVVNRQSRATPDVNLIRRLLVTQQAVLGASMDKRILLESQLAMFFDRDQFFMEGEAPRREFILPRKMNVWYRYAMRGLFAVSGLPVPLQRVIAGLISSALFSAMSTLWIAIKHMQEGGGIMAGMVLFLSLVIVIGLVYWHRKTLFYYLNANFLPRKIAMIAPAAYEHENSDEEEVVEIDDESKRCDKNESLLLANISDRSFSSGDRSHSDMMVENEYDSSSSYFSRSNESRSSINTAEDNEIMPAFNPSFPYEDVNNEYFNFDWINGSNVYDDQSFGANTGDEAKLNKTFHSMDAFPYGLLSSGLVDNNDFDSWDTSLYHIDLFSDPLTLYDMGDDQMIEDTFDAEHKMDISMLYPDHGDEYSNVSQRNVSDEKQHHDNVQCLEEEIKFLTDTFCEEQQLLSRYNSLNDLPLEDDHDQEGSLYQCER